MSACSQTLTDSIKYNIIEIGIRYDSLVLDYNKAIKELKQRESEIKALIDSYRIDSAMYSNEIERLRALNSNSDQVVTSALKELKRMEKKRFSIGPSLQYGFSKDGLRTNIGISIQWQLIRF